jgi:hypothetical protein
MFTLLDSAGHKIGKPFPDIDAARWKAQYIACVREERIQLVPAGRDIYPSDAGEIFMPTQERFRNP